MKGKQKSYFLVVSRLVPYKRVDLVVRVFNKNNLPLVVVGQGSEEAKLRRLARKNIKFTGFVSEQRLQEYYKNCRVLIFPQEEDFGLAAVEANRNGKPVIAFKKGGALDIIVEYKNGIFFDKQTEGCLAEAIARFDKKKFHHDIIVFTSRRFSKSRFTKEMLKLI